MIRQLLLLIEIFVLVYADLGLEGAVDKPSLVLGGDQLMRVYLNPTDAFLGVDGQAALDEIFGTSRYINSGEIGAIILDLLQDVVVVHPHVRILAIHHLIVDHSNGPNVGFEAVGLLLQHFRGHR